MRYLAWIAAVVLLTLGSLFAWQQATTAVTRIGKTCQQTVPIAEFDHSMWTQLLKKYVDHHGMVDYRSWKRSQSDRQKLDTYLESVSCAELGVGNQAATKALWLNLYNALTVRVILDHYPTSSIRNHTSFVGQNVWKHYKVRVGNRFYSLNEIEHQQLRPMQDPRIHFAIVCASVGCPPLRREAYVADRIDQQLDANTRLFFADPEKLRMGDGVIYLSPILKWFANDFGSNQEAVLNSISPFFPQQLQQLKSVKNELRVRYLDYDWSLNEQKLVNQHE